jgi:uncharacterized membrane protein (DUF4010 family)
MRTRSRRAGLLWGFMNIPLVFQQLAIAVALGLLVGVQRERTVRHLGGMRTFTLITMLGAVCGLLSTSLGSWTVAAGFVALAAIIIIGNVVALDEGKVDSGVTSEVAMLVMFGLGAYTMVGDRVVAIAIGGGVAVLLQFKEPLHGIAHRLTDKDVRALMQLVLVALVILPALPDQTFGPYDVLNPHRIWLMVVLIVGISLGGYVAYKLFGEGAGTVLSGVFGGLISSTATTVSTARLVAARPETSAVAATIIMFASAVVFARLVLELAVAAPLQFRGMAGPVGVMFGVFAALAVGVWLWGRKRHAELPEQENPANMKSALVFGLLYAFVLLAVAAAKDRFGTSGLYTVAAISGLTDVDAITLSTAQLVNTDALDVTTGWRVVLVAAASNLVFKAGMVAALGNRRLFAIVAVLYGLGLAATIALFLVWPAAV